MALEAGEAWTQGKIDALGSGRELDRLVESKVMGRLIRFAPGLACAWDGQGKPLMHGPEDWILEDYDPKRDGRVHPLAGNTQAVFHYSQSDDGMTRVMDQLARGKGFGSMSLTYSAADRLWRFEVRWHEDKTDESKSVLGEDPSLPRMAVYRGALKAVLL